MVTDRCTTACLMLTLTHLLPSYTLIFQILLSLDISSHYMHMYSSMMSGASSHKSISKDANLLLRLYYSNQHVLFLVCAGNELFFMTTYLLAPHNDVYSTLEAESLVRYGELIRWIWWISLPIFVFKQITNVIQLINAAITLADSDMLARKKGKEKARST